MEKWYQESKDVAAFYIVYIREAHPKDGKMPNPKNPADPKTVEERETIANDCIKSMKLTIPFLIDDMKDTANKAYSAWPDRIYIVGKDGKIAYKGSPGPQGFKPNDVKEKLKEVVGK